MALIAAILFAALLVLTSFAVNRRMLSGELVIDGYRLALTASSVLLLAVVAESVINPPFTQCGSARNSGNTAPIRCMTPTYRRWR